MNHETFITSWRISVEQSWSLLPFVLRVLLRKFRVLSLLCVLKQQVFFNSSHSFITFHPFVQAIVALLLLFFALFSASFISSPASLTSSRRKESRNEPTRCCYYFITHQDVSFVLSAQLLTLEFHSGCLNNNGMLAREKEESVLYVVSTLHVYYYG